MSENELPDWFDVAESADRLQLASTPAELHGALCGWLAGGGEDTAEWLARVMADPALPPPARGDALDRLHAACVAQLADPSFGLQLLLPEDVAIAERARALFMWCRAFLGGFGLAGGGKAMSEEAQEALADLANLAAAQIDEEDHDGDEEALTEIEEYLRMVAMLLHADCALRPQRGQRLH